MRALPTGLGCLFCLLLAMPASTRAQTPADTAKTKSGTVSPAPEIPAPSATAAPAAPASPTSPGNQPASPFLIDSKRLTEILQVQNPLVLPLVLCSVVAFGYFLERLFALRRGRVVPREFVNRFLDRLGTGKLDRERALDFCKANESPASRVFAQILMMWGEPAGQIRSAISQSVGMEYMILRRNIRVLNATATLAPLMGLLGTVVGIIESFNSLGGRNVPSKSAALAEGIGLALVMTALGLGVAIFSVTAYYYLLGKLDAMMVTLEQESVRVMEVICSSGVRSSADRRSGQIEMQRGIDSRIA